MDFNHTRSGNVIAKDAQIHGAQFIVNQGLSVIGHGTEVHAERNNGKPIISWGKKVVLGDRAVLWPAQVGERFMPMRIGHNVFIGADSRVEASSIGTNVFIGPNCQIGAQAVIRDCTYIPAGSEVPPSAVVGPMTRFHNPVERDVLEELPESAAEAIEWFCDMAYRGIVVDPPFA